ncbi:MAG: hypothetical protein ACKORG_04415 [Actinomycetota bacterium]
MERPVHRITIALTASAVVAAGALLAGCGSSSDTISTAPAGSTGTTRAAAADGVNPKVKIANNLPVAITATARDLCISGNCQVTPWTPDGSPFSGPAKLSKQAIPPGGTVERSWNATTFSEPHCRADLSAGSDYKNPNRAVVFVDFTDASGKPTIKQAWDGRDSYAVVQMGFAPAEPAAKPSCGSDPVLRAAGWIGGRGTSGALNGSSQCPVYVIKPQFAEFTYVGADGTTARGTSTISCGIGTPSAVVSLDPVTT